MPNPVLKNFGQPSAQGGVALLERPAPAADELNRWYGQPSYGSLPAGQPNLQQPAPPSRYMTLDDVVVRSGLMLLTILAAGTLSWLAAPDVARGLLLAGLLGGLAVGLYMSFTRKANAPLALTYSVFEGLLLGAISRLFNDYFHGIVIQAVTGTVMVAAGVLVVYKVGAIRVTPKFTRMVAAATIGVVGLMFVNLIAYFFTPDGLGLRAGGGLAIVFSLLCIGIAALNLVVDFDMIEQGIRRGADEKFAWYAAFGLMVTLIWLYLEILRLLSYLRN
jgi:uncharacterized YccA/Bax inhibitor family protein